MTRRAFRAWKCRRGAHRYRYGTGEAFGAVWCRDCGHDFWGAIIGQIHTSTATRAHAFYHGGF